MFFPRFTSFYFYFLPNPEQSAKTIAAAVKITHITR